MVHIFSLPLPTTRPRRWTLRMQCQTPASCFYAARRYGRKTPFNVCTFLLLRCYATPSPEPLWRYRLLSIPPRLPMQYLVDVLVVVFAVCSTSPPGLPPFLRRLATQDIRREFCGAHSSRCRRILLLPMLYSKTIWPSLALVCLPSRLPGHRDATVYQAGSTVATLVAAPAFLHFRAPSSPPPASYAYHIRFQYRRISTCPPA